MTGVIAWGDDGTGFVLQVTTPDWPGAGSCRLRDRERGETLKKNDEKRIKCVYPDLSLQILVEFSESKEN